MNTKPVPTFLDRVVSFACTTAYTTAYTTFLPLHLSAECYTVRSTQLNMTPSICFVQVYETGDTSKPSALSLS